MHLSILPLPASQKRRFGDTFGSGKKKSAKSAISPCRSSIRRAKMCELSELSLLLRRTSCEFSRRHSGWCPVVWCFPSCRKLLNQEDALSAPCLRCDFYSPQALSRGGAMLRTRLIRRFCGHITVCDHRLITLTSADVFPVVGGRRTGRARRCKAKQRRRVKTAPTCWILAPTVSTVFERRPERD